MQSDNIIEKARQLGLNTGNSSSSADNLRTIASQVGLSEFNSMYDLNKLENILLRVIFCIKYLLSHKNYG